MPPGACYYRLHGTVNFTESPNMRNTKLTSILLITSLFLMTACGQKGALYIPAETATPAASEMTDKAVEEEAKKKAAE